ncbi:hypothetical protein ACH79_27450 [Bradyrhizobium sp. CCBAU 051011]|uniref:hypothetical protein n=1 Tax=Bradyrhizobium sp. CCBAU 051011 TaxID=858422 RepID=UPI001373B356|nr:hypothetical protein [Bradyrhizobium sp. CCBAU 051011]QHO75791.1 hypothetical protein ACH79_27450 [Bradyrhizobium sp. CCBAU 051011]
MLLATLFVSVVSIPGATADDTIDPPDYFGMLTASHNFRADVFLKFYARYILSAEQSKRGPVLTAVADLFCVNRAGADAMANAQLAATTFLALSGLQYRVGARSSKEQPNCINQDILRKRADNRAERVAAFAEPAFRQGRPELHVDGPSDLGLIFEPVSAKFRTFTSSGGTTITYTLIMAPNASGTAFGPQVYMDENNKAAVCAVSPMDTETISAFRNSLADAFVQEAADPGRGLPSINVDRSVAANWAISATSGIMGRCLLVNNDERDPTT